MYPGVIPWVYHSASYITVQSTLHVANNRAYVRIPPLLILNMIFIVTIYTTSCKVLFQFADQINSQIIMTSALLLPTIPYYPQILSVHFQFGAISLTLPEMCTKFCISNRYSCVTQASIRHCRHLYSLICPDPVLWIVVINVVKGHKPQATSPEYHTYTSPIAHIRNCCVNPQPTPRARLFQTFERSRAKTLTNPGWSWYRCDHVLQL